MNNLFTGSVSDGSEGCPCINPLNLASFKAPICTNETSLPFCYPPGYGLSCAQNEILFKYPDCTGDSTQMPTLCFEKWCYVDRNICADSDEILYKSNFFPDESLYYSYSTCGSDAKPSDLFPINEILNGRHLIAEPPDILYPYHYKLNSSGDVIASDAPEYWNDSIPWRGSVIDYVNDILNLTEYASITYTHRSHGSDLIHPESSYTATVDDIHRGLADFGVSIFWVTEERLKKAAFAAALEMDTMVMFEPRVSTSDGDIWKSFRMITAPFTWQVWLVFIIIIYIVSYFSVWFAVSGGPHSTWYDVFHSDHYKNSSRLEKLKLSLPVYTESIMMSFTYFLANGIDYDLTSSYSYKILMIGFGFVVMMFFSLYISRLSSISTVEQIQASYVGTMENAIRQNKRLCATPALKKDYDLFWPTGNFVYNNDAGNYVLNMLDFYDQGKCDIIVTSIREIKMNEMLYAEFCNRNVVKTGTAIEKYLALPSAPDISAAITSTMEIAKAQGILYENYEKEYFVSGICSLDADNNEKSNGNNGTLNIQDMMAAIVVFLICLFVAIGIKLRQIYFPKKVRRGIRRYKTKLCDYGASVLSTANDTSTGNRNNLAFSLQNMSEDSVDELPSFRNHPSRVIKSATREEVVLDENKETNKDVESVTLNITLPANRENVDKAEKLLEDFFENLKKNN